MGVIADGAKLLDARCGGPAWWRTSALGTAMIPLVRLPWRRRRDPDDDGRAPTAIRGVYGIVGALATVIDVIVGIVTVLIVLGIALFVLGANMDNAIVGAIHDAAEFLVGPFADIFERDNAKEEVAINWGIAVVVYFVIGRVIAAVLRRGST